MTRNRFTHFITTLSRVCTTAALFIGLSACGGGTTEPPLPLVATSIDAYDFTSVATGKTLVARDDAGYQAVWTQQLGPRVNIAPPPSVDFSKSAVVGMWLGERGGCSGVRIDSVVDTGSRIEVRYFERRPSPLEVCVAVVKRPGLVVSVPHRNLPVVALEVVCTADCSR